MGSLVTLLTTGGTLATTTSSVTSRSAPTRGPDQLAELVEIPDVRIRARAISQQPSWALDPAAMASIAIAARDAAAEPGTDGVVVTHGTTTLEYTAFLTSLIVDGPVPVVLTGAMHKADDPDPDGPRNLQDAVLLASSTRSRPRGVFVVFAGRVIAARHVWKARRVDTDAFVDTVDQVGSVLDGVVTLTGTVPSGIGLSGRLNTNVAYVKVLPGLDSRGLDRALADDPAGIVVEGLPGVGGVPPALQQRLIALTRDLPVVLASRAPFGRLPDVVTGGTGEPFRGADLWSAGSLTAEQAWLALMAALGDGDTTTAVRARFEAIAFGR